MSSWRAGSRASSSGRAARKQARALGVAGWVRNAPDGRVEAVFEGPEAAVEAMVDWCRRGPAHARVDAVEVERETPAGDDRVSASRARKLPAPPGFAGRPLLASRRMFLRQIQIRGFKSFADKTVLEFIPGVSVIVGPNGSGKSNLVDAISWALGEQGARALRGGHMADVIFAGTPSRPALGMAEVKLVIDNAAGKIAVPMSEIEVSRTIFRSGESEYRINGQVVRLLDVQELLSETGIGRALHTVVGQGQLEEVLLARPEERRKYIEEAAGIAKHRRRKERAERKLSGLDQDLLRLQDVLAELRRQLKPLQQQAEMAKKHETLTEQAEELSRKLAAARLRALMRERARRKDGWDQGLEARKSARELLDGLDGQVLQAADDRAAAARGLADAEQVVPSGPGRAHRRRPGVPDRRRARVGRAGAPGRGGVADRAHRRRRPGAGPRRAGARPRHHRARGRRARAGSRGAGVPRGRGAPSRGRGRPATDGRGGRRAPSRDGGAPPQHLVVRARTGAPGRRPHGCRGADRGARRGAGAPRGGHRARGRADLAARRPADAARAGAANADREDRRARGRRAPASSPDRPARGPAARHRGDARLAVPGVARRTRDRPAPRSGAASKRVWSGRSSRRSGRSPTPSSTRTGTVPSPTPPRATAPSSRSRRADRSRSASAASARCSRSSRRSRPRAGSPARCSATSTSSAPSTRRSRSRARTRRHRSSRPRGC